MKVATKTTAELEAILGPRGSFVTTKENRWDVRKWLTAQGFKAFHVNRMTFRELSGAYNDVTGINVETLRLSRTPDFCRFSRNPTRRDHWRKPLKTCPCTSTFRPSPTPSTKRLQTMKTLCNAPTPRQTANCHFPRSSVRRSRATAPCPAGRNAGRWPHCRNAGAIVRAAEQARAGL